MKITLLTANLSDLQVAIARYPGCIYWDVSMDTLDGKSTSLERILIDVKDRSGTFLLNGIIPTSGIDFKLMMQLINLANYDNPELHVVLFKPPIDIPPDLYSYVYFDTIPLPSSDRVGEILDDYGIKEKTAIKSCLGLSEGEIHHYFRRFGMTDDLPNRILQYKLGKLAAIGLPTVPSPDVEVAGLDNLNALLDTAKLLLDPEVQQYNLKFPKGVLLWGIPGTGKSLAAKHAASRMGIPIIALDWSSVLDERPGQSEANLRNILEISEAMSPCVLYADDFDKAFSASDLSGVSPTERRIAGMLLTWLQDCEHPVFFMASVNRAEQMPPELLRRFEDIVFVDYPHQGQMYEVFNFHLKNYTDNFEATQVEWQQILQKYQTTTPAEIGRAVSKAAIRAYLDGHPTHITPDNLIKQRDLFVSAFTRDQAAILRIQKNSSLAIPATSDDNSEFRVRRSKMFSGYLGEENV